MDPTANLKEQLELARSLTKGSDQLGAYDTVDTIDAVRLAELVLALDGWIKKGGFLPEQWKRNT